MDLYILDENFERVFCIDVFNSLVWNDKYMGYGDFKLRLAFNQLANDVVNFIVNKKKQNLDVYIKMETDIMIIDTFEMTTEAESGYYIDISGKGLESILERRIIWGVEILEGNLHDEVKRLINDAIINPENHLRKIDNFIFEDSVDERILELWITAQYTGDVLYEVIYNICESNKLGFRITLNTSNQFVFKLFKGQNRSFDQDKNSYVIFSPMYDNLTNSDYINSSNTYKNVSLVAGEDYDVGVSSKDWTVTQSGSYGFHNSEENPEIWRSNNTGVASSSAITTWKYTAQNDGELMIFWSVMSEQNFDKLTIWFNGLKIVNEISGSLTNLINNEAVPKTGSFKRLLKKGRSYTLKAKYSKDGSVDIGDDSATVRFKFFKNRRLREADPSQKVIEMPVISRELFNFSQSQDNPQVWQSNNTMVPSSTALTTWVYIPNEQMDLQLIWNVMSQINKDKLYITFQKDKNSKTTIVNGVSGYTDMLMSRIDMEYTNDDLLIPPHPKDDDSIDTPDPMSIMASCPNHGIYSFNGTSALEPGHKYTFTAKYVKDKSVDTLADMAAVKFVLTKSGSTDYGENRYSGLGRIELFVDAKDIQSDKTNKEITFSDYMNLLLQRGLEKLTENKYTYAFTAEVDATNTFVYGKDFFIGDVVQIENEFGMRIKAMIIESVHTNDEKGFVTYPTFKILEE